MTVRVLIVDDHPTFRRFARRLLEDGGFAVVGEAGDGAAGAEAIRELRPDAILLDVLLPDRSGIDLAAEWTLARPAPAVVLTSSRSADDLGAALRGTPARGFIPKSELTAAGFAHLLEAS